MESRKKFDKSRWMLERERFGISNYAPPRPDPDLSLRSAVTRLFKMLDCQADSVVRQIQRKWKLIAGEVVAGHSCPGRLAGDILYIYVDSSAWLAEITRMHSENILCQIRREIGPGPVKEIRFQVNPKQCRPALE